jgi:uncharacterized membrane protein YcaP (DUF421 family)
MFATVEAILNEVLGLDRSGNDLQLEHMIARTVVVFMVAVLLVRLADRRFLSHHAGFDMMVAVVLGSVLSRAINGDARFFPTLAASVLLVVLHHLLASLAFRSHRFSQLLKGQARVLVRNGVVDHEAMRQAKITPDDLEATLRLQGKVCRLEDVVEARLERSGAVSVLPVKSSYQPFNDAR